MKQNDPTFNTQTTAEQQYEYRGLDWLKTLIVITIMAIITIGLIMLMNIYKPEAKKDKPPKSAVIVAAQNPKVTDYPIKIASNGTVSASTRGMLTSEVSGQITQLSPNFNNGGIFQKGEVLAQIDARNFEVGVSSAKSSIVSAKAQVAQARASQMRANSSASQAESTILAAQSNYDREKALADQARRDWQRLGYTGEPNDLVLRKQQLSAALAQLAAAKTQKQSAIAEKQVSLAQEQSALAQIDTAKAALSKAELDTSRTKVRAPYSGVVIKRSVELGQYVNPGSSFGEIFSNAGLELQLPLNQRQFSQLDIASKPIVELYTSFGGKKHTWQAQIIRADSIFDTTTRQINVTAKINNPISDGAEELRIGQYLSAVIQGRTISAAIVIPNGAIREGGYVFVLENGILRRQDIDIVWQDTQNTIVNDLLPTAMVVTTSVGGGANGTRAKLVDNKNGIKTTRKNQENQYGNNTNNTSNKPLGKHPE